MTGIGMIVVGGELSAMWDMNPFGLPPFFVILVIAVVVFLLVATASQHRRHSSQTDVRLCRGCGAGHPAFAQFCRRCGRKL